MLSRRELLLLQAAALATACVPPGVVGSGGPRFAEADRALIRSLAEAIYGEGAARLPVVEGVEAMLAAMPEDRSALVLRLPALFDRLGIAFGGRAWSSLDAAGRQALLEDWEASTLALRRRVVQVLRQLILLACYTDPATFAELGYGGPWLGRHPLPVHPPRFGDPEVGRP